jgi:iron complex outermembrane receptor protein
MLRKTLLASLLAAQLNVAQAAEPVSIDIPAQPLATALAKLAEQSGIKALYAAELLAGKTAPRVAGKLTPQQALEQLLAGSGLRYQVVGDDAVRIEAVPVGKTTELAPIEVRESLEHNYAAARVRSATRTDAAIETIPQTVVVVPRALIEDQAGRTMSEVLRNVSNVNQVDARDSNNVGFKIRGFNSALVLDGVAMPGYFHNQESLVNIERIDVLKGPAGGLFGSGQGGGSYGTLGGSLVVTTSEPEDTSYRKVAVSAGSYSAWGAALDINQPINPTLAVRLVGEANRSENEADRVFFERTALFPSLAWTPSQDTKLVLRLRHLDNTTLDYSGLPPSGTLDTSTYTLPRSRIITAEGLPDTTNVSDGLNVQWEQRLNAAWVFNLTTAYNQTEVDQRGVAAISNFCFGSFGAGGPVHDLCGIRLWDRFKATNVSPSLTGKLTSGEVQHTLNLGIDYERTVDDAFMVYSSGGMAYLGSVDLRNPIYPVWDEPVAPATPDQQNRYTSTVAYVQDQIDVGAWHLLASLRQSRIKVHDVNSAWGISNVSTNNKLSPRVGAVYEFTPQVSAFAGYATGAKVPTISMFSTAPKPEEYQQAELGLRLKQFNGVTASLALFDLKRKNATVADPANFGFSIQAGEQRSQGVDLDLTWQATPSMSWLAALSSQQAEISEDTNPALANKKLYNVPEQTARLAMRYDLHTGDWKGLGFGLGATYHSRLAGNSTNTFFTPAATVFDAQLSYHLKQVRLGLAVNNLADKKYYLPSAYFAGGQVTPAAPRTITATASLEF